MQDNKICGTNFWANFRFKTLGQNFEAKILRPKFWNQNPDLGSKYTLSAGPTMGKVIHTKRTIFPYDKGPLASLGLLIFHAKFFFG